MKLTDHFHIEHLIFLSLNRSHIDLRSCPSCLTGSWGGLEGCMRKYCAVNIMQYWYCPAPYYILWTVVFSYKDVLLLFLLTKLLQNYLWKIPEIFCSFNFLRTVTFEHKPTSTSFLPSSYARCQLLSNLHSVLDWFSHYHESVHFRWISQVSYPWAQNQNTYNFETKSCKNKFCWKEKEHARFHCFIFSRSCVCQEYSILVF